MSDIEKVRPKVLSTSWDDGTANVHKRIGSFINYFQCSLPKNSNGIPLQMIDPTVVLQYGAMCEQPDDFEDEWVAEATLPVTFEEGFPTLGGVPIWERLDGEAIPYYNLFKEYREMRYYSATRSIAQLSADQGIAGAYLNHLSKMFHWQIRVKAYDQYQALVKDRKREIEIERMESRHTASAAVMLEQAMDYLAKHPEQLNPKVALQMVQTAVKVGRLSVGLGAESGGRNGRAGGTVVNVNNTQNSVVGDNPQMVAIDTTRGSTSDFDTDQLQSILHVLDKSGAFEAMNNPEVIDVDVEE